MIGIIGITLIALILFSLWLMLAIAKLIEEVKAHRKAIRGYNLAFNLMNDKLLDLMKEISSDQDEYLAKAEAWKQAHIAAGFKLPQENLGKIDEDKGGNS